jgi:hypothetical protein
MPSISLGLSIGDTSSTTTSYDPTALAWIAAVESLGGTVSIPARNLLNRSLLTPYNGIRFSSYKSKFSYLWIPLSDFSGIRAPLIGSTFTQVGLVSGDYSLANGVQFNGTSKRLQTGVLANSVANNNTTLMIGANNSGLYGTYWLTGGGLGTSIMGMTTVSATMYNQAGDGDIAFTMSTNDVYIATRDSATNFNVYRNETLIGSKTGSTTIGTLPAQEIWIGSAFINGVTQGSLVRADFASYGQALTNAERISFTRMLNDIRAARSTL